MYTYQEKDILECEFYVVETLQFDLILHHPFPALLQFVLECVCCLFPWRVRLTGYGAPQVPGRVRRSRGLPPVCLVRACMSVSLLVQPRRLTMTAIPRQLVQYSYRTDIILLHPPFMVAYAAAYISCMESGYDAAQVFANVNLKHELLLQIVGEFRAAFDEEKQLHAVQPAALEKLEELVPDAAADADAPSADK
jgi:hypothetical protein